MSGGGSDKSRAGFTSRVVVITETDGMDQPGSTSRESDKITQLEARTRAYGSRKRIYMECTVSTEQGRTWQEYQQGTQSRIVLALSALPGLGQPGARASDRLAGRREPGRGPAGRRVLLSGLRRGLERGRAHCRPISERRLLHDGQTIDAEGDVAGRSARRPTRWASAGRRSTTCS